jgi:DNA polymerase-1
MEKRGILLDREYLGALSKRYHTDLDEMAKRIFDVAGMEFNLNSPRQLGEVLYEKLGIGGGKNKRTATGQLSTREDELKKHAEKNPIVADILEYRELQKLLSTYIDNLPGMTDAEGRLHAHFLQAGTTTGRMSSQSPNMQNIPIKTTRGAAIRRAIIVPQGFTLLAADYSQIELRVAAFLSGDEKLISYFKEGTDIHTAVAAQVFNVPPELVDKEMRRRAKAINFGILYGMGSNALAAATGTTKTEAQQYLAEYFKRFSGIARYVETVKNEVHNRGYTETWFGRRRHLEGIRSPLPHIVASAERMALNAPIQGTQADIIKIAMVKLDEVLRSAGHTNDAFLTCQVHDELLYEVRDSALQAVIPLVRTTMENILSLEDTRGVPLKVDIEIGKNWGEMVSASTS